MKVLIAASCVLLPVAAHCQSDSSAALISPAPVTHRPHSVLATVALGFIDGYRVNYPVPAGYSKSSTSGFAPLMARLEYTTDHISFGASAGYDAFVANLQKQLEGNNGTFTRYIASGTRIVSLGITGFWHFRHFLPSQFDPFIGASLSLNNMRYNAWPQGDTTAVKVDHSVTPSLKAGTRYYISRSFSLYADAGYDKHAVVNVGFSARFSRHHSSPAPVTVADTAQNPTAPDTVAVVFNQPPVAQQPIVQQPVIKTPDAVYKDTISTSVTEDSSPDKPVTTELILPVTAIQFQLNKTTVSPASIPALDHLADLLLTQAAATLLIDGYADTTGNDAINNRISLARAQGIKKYLVSKGVPPARIIATGHGSRSPIASNRTRAGRAKNRRVALKLK